MDPISSKTALASAGASGEKVYVDDLFSTTLYEGTDYPGNTVDTGIEFDEKWLIWQKNRSGTGSNLLTDSEMTKTTGEYPALRTNTTGAETTTAGPVTISGSTVEYSGSTNNLGATHALWSFKAAPGFFDVVRYTGTGSVQNISHNLGSTPGMIIVKQTSSTESWGVYHRSLAASETVLLSGTNMAFSSPNSWNSTAPTDSVFTVGTEARVNQNGQTYVAYLFAHNDQQFGAGGDEAIVHCGSFNGGGVLNSNTIEVNTGFEPQWVLIKRTETTSDWYIFDTMRGMDNDGNNDKALFPNDSNAEGSPFRLWAYQNGFAFDEDLGGSSAEWIYMAIRRPNKPPEAATDVFAIDNQGTGTMPPQYHSNFPVDWAFTVAFGETQTYRDRESFARLIGKKSLKLNETTAETNHSSARWDYMDGWYNNNSSVSTTYSWMFKRAPGFFDVALYTGTGSAQAIDHNLEVAPEFIITKTRSNSGYNWICYHSGLSSAQHMIVLNGSSGEQSSGLVWNNTAPTATQFSVNSGENNYSGQKEIAYLFATLPGISKVGSYTGNGTSQVIDCGFTSGARFVLIKAKSISNDWRVFDTTRGINASANDPVFSLNDDAAEDPNKDWLRPNNSGFEVNTSNDNVNGNNQEYIFLAIA